ncbi:MAG: glycosyltransferase [Patescibacteria group bacterium]
MKTIYYVANYRMPTERAHGLQVAMMCDALAACGWDVTLVVPRRGRRSSDIFSYYNLRHRFRVVYLPVLDLTGKVPVIGFWLQSTTFAMLAMLFIMKQRYRGTIYSRDQFTLFLMSFLLRNKLIYEMHTMPGVIRGVHRHLFRKLQCIVAISEGLKRELIAAGCSSDSLVVSPDAFDAAQLSEAEDGAIELRSRLLIAKDDTLVLYAGSLMPWKGVDTLVRAVELLPHSYNICVLGGSESDRERLRMLVSSHTSSQVHFLRAIPHGEIGAYLREADILVIPNSGRDAAASRYTSPMKFYEYLASGKPVVASDVPALHEVGDVFQGVYYFQADDPSALAVALQRARKGERLYRREMTNHTWDARAQFLSRYL